LKSLPSVRLTMGKIKRPLRVTLRIKDVNRQQTNGGRASWSSELGIAGRFLLARLDPEFVAGRLVLWPGIAERF
jgi:hypothetical protein